MRDSLQPFKGDNYDRPNQQWVCGLADEGKLCPTGPVQGGQCPGASACHPLRDGDRWVCNRSASRGGVCDNGPASEGECCIVYQCQPLPSMRVRRGSFVLGSLLAAFGGLVLMLSSDARNDWLAPGELTKPHAQLLSRGGDTNRCASCHAAGEQSFFQWVGHAASSELASPSQSQLCMDCHKNTIDPKFALAAHSVASDQLLANSNLSVSRRVDPTEQLACSTCHQEHYGAEHDLKWMSDQSCQACHQQQLESFATDHPEFDNWPLARRTRIAFDHGSHQLKHFPKQQQQFACATCHVAGQDGKFQRTLGYQQSCQKCHDSKIAVSWDAGVEVFALPMIDAQQLNTAGRNIGQWPAPASDEFDGALPPITKLLLIADKTAEASLRQLGADFDFFDVDSDDPQQLRAAANIVWATKRLLNELSLQGQKSIEQRLESVLDRELSATEFSQLTSRLSPENFAVMTQVWLTNLPNELNTQGQQQVAVPAVRTPAQDRKVAQDRVSAGGWFSDENSLSIRYQPTGHADPFIKSWINVMVEASNGKHMEVTKPLIKDLLSPTVAGQCGSCHSLDRRDEGTYVVNWFARQTEDQTSSFTKFSHGPHLAQSELADCQSCHQINPMAAVMET